MRKFISISALCLFSPFVSIDAAEPASPSFCGKLVAASNTASGITGNIVILPHKVLLQSGDSFSIKNPRPGHISLKALDIVEKHDAIAFDITSSTLIKGLHGNRLCGFDADTLWLWRNTISPKETDVVMTMTKGAVRPNVPAKQDCGTFSYIKDR